MTRTYTPSIHIYQCNPIDEWMGWRTLRKIVAKSRRNDVDQNEMSGWGGCDPVKFAQAAMRAAAQRWADADEVRGRQVYLSSLPLGGCASGFMVAWKVSNNGTTYVASPFHLPWLDREALDMIITAYDHGQAA